MDKFYKSKLRIFALFLILILGWVGLTLSTQEKYIDNSIPFSEKVSRKSASVEQPDKAEENNLGGVEASLKKNNSVVKENEDHNEGNSKEREISSVRNQVTISVNKINVTEGHDLDLKVERGQRFLLFPEYQVFKFKEGAKSDLGAFSVQKIANDAANLNHPAVMGWLVKDEAQNNWSILTGKIIIKLKSFQSTDQFMNDHSFQVVHQAPEIRTLYVRVLDLESMHELNQELAQDSRVERFNFEVMKVGLKSQ